MRCGLKFKALHINFFDSLFFYHCLAPTLVLPHQGGRKSLEVE